MKRAALVVLVLILSLAAALVGMVVGAVLAFDPPKPAAQQPLMVHPLSCDARVIVSAAGHVYKDACYVRRSPQVWL